MARRCPRSMKTVPAPATNQPMTGQRRISLFAMKEVQRTLLRTKMSNQEIWLDTYSTERSLTAWPCWSTRTPQISIKRRDMRSTMTRRPPGRNTGKSRPTLNKPTTIHTIRATARQLKRNKLIKRLQPCRGLRPVAGCPDIAAGSRKLPWHHHRHYCPATLEPPCWSPAHRPGLLQRHSDRAAGWQNADTAAKHTARRHPGSKANLPRRDRAATP